ncbi:DUF4373 domain-containing protein [uncultured Parabacteroides sp.]|uniref:DUF4373 domain-containing protein n=1 Tax=uncultured Parabacteroides sp. TaxID=512312 RepID=UPI00261145CC|nr:DUF4373 domain-containing protein [uncultured Parabacteroides sp.]
MSRPIKKGLSYFPLDTDMLSNRKIRRLFQSQGCEGFAAYTAILCEVYGTTGYYVRYTDDLCFDIGFTLNLKEEQVRKIIGFCVEIRLFNQELFDRQKILTSLGIQSRYREISKRNVSRISPEWELRDETHPVSAKETGVSATKTPVSATKTTPKGKGKRKEKESKTNIVTKIQANNEHSTSNDNGEAGRRAELLQMAANATSTSRHA